MEIKLPELCAWIQEINDLCRPKRIHLCAGSKEEYNELIQEMLASGMAKALPKRENSYYFASDPGDVARVEECTFICSEDKSDAGPTNHWCHPKEMKERLHHLFAGCMKGRTMYIIPYSMGPIGSKLSRFGVEITDSPYVVCNMSIMTRMGKEALEGIETARSFIPGIHSVGAPLEEGERDLPWPCNKEKVIAHFPETREIWSYGSGYGGNALLGKKCFALRIASKIAQEEGWMAEHMLILGLTNPQGKKKYFAAAFPSSCGKTNLAMLSSPLPGWKVECVGDDIAWMRFGKDGRLYAINPENGYFGVAPGTSYKTNPSAMKAIEKNTLFTNVARTKEGDVWWEGMSPEVPPDLIDWKGNPYVKGSTEKAAHPNSRFTVSMRQCPLFDPKADDLQGVPIEGIIFGGRRSDLTPLVVQALDWKQGVLMGAMQVSEQTAAASGTVGKLRHDPFAMLPFCGYHMGDYFAHWLSLAIPGRNLPKIFSVNWFRKDREGNYLWPGYGENMRVLKWCFEEIDGEGKRRKTPIGYVPSELDLHGINVSCETLDRLLHVDGAGYAEEIARIKNYFTIFGEKFPAVLAEELDQILHQIMVEEST